jgi:CheY-like chemotaxis protein
MNKTAEGPTSRGVASYFANVAPHFEETTKVMIPAAAISAKEAFLAKLTLVCFLMELRERHSHSGFYPGRGAVMKILLVDDDPVYLNLLGEILTLYSHSVLKAPDGEAASAILKRDQVDLIVSDVSMPKMNGVHLHTSIREDRRTKRIPFVWNSAYQELRDLLPLSDPTLDFKFDKAAQLSDLLYLIGHLEAARSIAGQKEPRPRAADEAVDTPIYS